MQDKVDSPVTLFHEFHSFVRDYDADGQANLFSDDGVWELPLATGAILPAISGRAKNTRVRKDGHAEW